MFLDLIQFCVLVLTKILIVQLSPENREKFQIKKHCDIKHFVKCIGILDSACLAVRLRLVIHKIKGKTKIFKPR